MFYLLVKESEAKSNVGIISMQLPLIFASCSVRLRCGHRGGPLTGAVTDAARLVLCGSRAHMSFVVTRAVRLPPASSACGLPWSEEGPEGRGVVCSPVSGSSCVLILSVSRWLTQGSDGSQKPHGVVFLGQACFLELS